MQADYQPVADRPQRVRTARARVSNGSALLPGVDGRSTWARRMRDLMELHVADLGGETNISEGERAIVRRAAVLITELERMEATFALCEGAPDLPHLDGYQRAANSLRRLLEAVGLQRRARDVTPSITQYLRATATAVASGAVAAPDGAP
jgi:hypothetical protein